MQETGPELNISWGRTAFFAGLILTLVTILSKLKAIGRLLSKLAAFLGRKIILSLLNSDSKEAKDAIAQWFAAELTEGIRTRELVGQLEDQVVMTQADIRAFREEMAVQRAETRQDIQVAVIRMDNRLRDFETAIGKNAGETQRTLREMADSMLPIREELQSIKGYMMGIEGMVPRRPRRGDK